MKKLLLLAAIFVLVFAACPTDDGTTPNNNNNNGNKNTKTILTINNVSDYNLLGVEYASVDFGTINSGKDITKEVNSGTRYIFFNLLIKNEQVRCRTTNVLVCEESVNNEITITNNTQITITGNDNTNTLRNIYDLLTRGTTLAIHNTSDYNLLSVEYASINFGTINSGRDSTKEVNSGTRPVFFNLLIKNESVRCRTTQEMTCNEGTVNEITITNNTSITITGVENTDTLKNIFDWLNRPRTPGRPTVKGGDRSIRVSWTTMNDATSYRIYCGTNTTPPETPTINTTGTSANITNLINDVTYYVWLQAVNSSGASDLSERVQVTPTTNFTVNSRDTFLNAVEIINDAADGTYTITVTGSFASPLTNFVSGANKTIIIAGDTVSRTISNSGTTSFFVVRSGITLELGNNITLNGNNEDGEVVYVQAGGTFIMNNGSTVRGSEYVGVYSEGTFTMNGGTITDNYYEGVDIGSGTFTMNGGTIRNNEECGVYIDSGASFNMTDGLINGNVGGVHNEGTFTMSGGTISNNTSLSGGGVYNEGRFTMSGGTISNNTVTGGSGGGGVYNGGGIFNMDGGSIINNTVTTTNSTSNGGGGVYTSNGTFTMTNGLISGNAVNAYGGGVYVRFGSFSKTGGTISDTNSTTVTNRGKVVFVYLTSTTNRKRETAAGPTVNLNSTVTGTSGGWE